MLSADDIAAAIGGCRPDGRGGYRGPCPAHNGKSADVLSIGTGNDGRVLIHCFAGCSAGEVLRSVGLSWGSALPERDTQQRSEAKSATASRERKEKQQCEQEERYAKAAAEARRIYEVSADITAENHPYLLKKGVKPVYGLKLTVEAITIGGLTFLAGSLAIPAFKQDGKISTLQVIDAEGNKRFLPGGRKAGTFFPVNENGDGPLVIAEGLVTALSVHESTEYPTLVAFDAGNLISVATFARNEYPGREIILAADNDVGTDGNPGVTKATEAAQAINGKFCIPDPIDSKSTDWNDVHKAHGLERTRELFLTSLIALAVEDTAKAATGEIPQQRAIIPRTALQYLTEAILEPEPLIEGILPLLCTLVIYGLEKSGKTWLALQLAFLLITGGDFFGFEIRGKHRVLFVSPEGADPALKARLQALYLYIPNLDDEDMGRLHLVSTLGSLKVDMSEGEAVIRQWIKDTGANVVIFDSWYRLTSAQNKENSNDDQKAAQDMLDRLKAMGVTIIIVHHARKPGDTDKGVAEIRGAGLGPYADSIIRLSKSKSGKHALSLVLRHYPEPHEIVLKRQGPVFALPDADDWEVKPKYVRDILESHGGRVEGKTEFFERIKVAFPEASGSDIKRAVKGAEDQGLIQFANLKGGSGGNKFVVFIPLGPKKEA